MNAPSFKIGRRLVAAFSATTLITLLVGGIAFHTWNQLGTQVSEIRERSIPLMTATHQLERASTRIQSLLDKTNAENDLIEHENLTEEINAALLQIADAGKQAQRRFNQDLDSQGRFDSLSATIEKHNALVKEQITLNHALTQTHKRISWLHQDINDEFAPLLQEVEWHLEQLSYSDPQLDIRSMVREFAVLQDIHNKEGELIQLVNEIVTQRYQRDLDSAFRFIGFKISELEREQSELEAYPSTITHRQILEDIIALVQPGGTLNQRLEQEIRVHGELNKVRDTLNQQLAGYHIWVGQLVDNANKEMAAINEKTQAMVVRSQTQISLLLVISLLTSTLVLVFLIGRKLVYRLNTLSDELSAVTSGKVNTPITISGNDEIGRLGDTLRTFCRQVQEIERSNALNLINNTQVSLITCHPNGTIETVNPSALALFGQKAAGQAQKLWDLTSGTARTELKRLFVESRSLHSDGVSECTLEVDINGETRYLTFYFRRFTHNRSWKFIVTLTDTTRQELTARQLADLVDKKTIDLRQKNRMLTNEIEERKRTELELVSTQDELIQAAKMAVVGQAMTSLAHELNQPLAAISNYLYTARLATQSGQTEYIEENLGKVEKLCFRMSRVISGLRHFAKKSPLSQESIQCDIRDVADNAIELLESRTKSERVTITNTLPSGVKVCGDAVQLEQVFVNLCVNSIDALAGGDTRAIHIEPLPGSPGRFRFAVSDSGSGFPPDIIDRLFVPFSTTKDVGLGLGLSICRSILRRFNANIYIASTLSGGAMVVLECCNDNCG